MIRRTITSSLAAATLALTIAGTGVSAANAAGAPKAASPTIEAMGPGEGDRITVQHRRDDRNWRHGRDWRHGWDWRRDRHGRHGRDWRAARFCSPREAIHKARRMGIRRAGIARINPRAIVVAGRHWGRHARVVFARHSRHCAVISRRGF